MLNNISISLPPKKLREEFNNKVGKILTLISIKKKEIKMLSLLSEVNISMIAN